jgi:hypothetical protein
LNDRNREKENEMNKVGKIASMLVVLSCMCSLADTIMTTSGDPRTEGNWDNGLPALDNRGFIGADKTATITDTDDVQLTALWNISGTMEKTGAGHLYFMSNSDVVSDGVIRVDDGNLRFNRTNVEMNGGTVSCSSTLEILGTGGTRSVILNSGSVAAGSLSMTAYEGHRRELLIRGGSVNVSGAVVLNDAQSGPSVIAFDGTGGSLEADSLSVGADCYIDFISTVWGEEGANAATLTVTGFAKSDYVSLYDSNDLRFNSDNTEVFDDVFQVNGSTISVIPEPGTVGLFFISSATLLLWRRAR